MAEFNEGGREEKEEGKKKEKKSWLSLPKSKSELILLNLKGTFHPAMKMAYKSLKIQRSPNQAFIFLIGESGSGKSATINYLFNEEVAKVNKTESEQRSTTEYVVSMESEEWQIPDLTLSVVDTPGFSDTEGLEQDIKNFASIIAFREQHPHLKGYFPNLVFLVMRITENRIEGSSSKFSKLLRTLNVLDIVDKRNYNMILILTHAAMLPQNQEIFERRVVEMKKIVSKMVESLLEITPLIVIQENQPVEYGLEKEGDWHILPNKERQPLTLFKGCKTILNLSEDELCHEAISVYFRENERSKPHIGHSFDASTITQHKLQKIEGALLEPIFPSNDSEVSTMLDKYLQGIPAPPLASEIVKLKKRFKSIDIASAEQLQSISMNDLKIRIKPTHISPYMEKILEDVFGMQYEQMCGLDCGIGRGFDLFSDNIILKTPYVLDDCKTGKLGLPEKVTIKHCNYFEIKCQEVENQDEYVKERLNNLKIGVGPNLNLWKFCMQVRGGYNLKQEITSASKITKDDTSFSIEQRRYKITLSDSNSYSGEFIADVMNLPERYVAKDKSNVEKWDFFFSKWGYCVVMGMYLGGNVSGNIQTKEKNESHAKRNCKDGQAKLSFKLLSFQQQGLLDFDKESSDNAITGEESSFTSSSLQWIGGETSPKTSSFENLDKGDWVRWLESLEYKPAPLSTSLDLCPIYLLIDKIDKDKCIEVKKAMESEIFGDIVHINNQKVPFMERFFEAYFDFIGVNAYLKTLDDRNSISKSHPNDGCFDESSLMHLSDGNKKKMKDMSTGDKVLSVDKFGNLVHEKIIAWLHKLPEGYFSFIKIEHSLGSLVITPEHIIYLGEQRTPAFASSVKPNDTVTVFVNSNDAPTTTLSKVISVEHVERKGVFAPLTLTGNAIVDGVAVSCYCKVKPIKLFGREIMSSQSLAHLAFFPMRTAYMLGIDIDKQQNDKCSGIHYYAKSLMNLTNMN